MNLLIISFHFLQCFTKGLCNASRGLWSNYDKSPKIEISTLGFESINRNILLSFKLAHNFFNFSQMIFKWTIFLVVSLIFLRCLQRVLTKLPKDLKVILKIFEKFKFVPSDPRVQVSTFWLLLDLLTISFEFLKNFTNSLCSASHGFWSDPKKSLKDWNLYPEIQGCN